jgi:hypothetical protein
MNTILSGSDGLKTIRPYLGLDKPSFEAYDKELESLTNTVHTAQVLKAHLELDNALKRFQEIFEAEARTLGKTGTKEDYKHLKERVHSSYNQLAFPFVKLETPQPLAEVALRCYYALKTTLVSLEKSTGYQFDYGLAYHNSGIALARIGDMEGAVTRIELANIEDIRIGHTGGKANPVLNEIMEAAWSECDRLAHTSKLSLASTKVLVQSLETSEQYRILDIILRYTHRIRDYRGYLVKDTLERNLNSIAKLTEAYLRRIRPSKETAELVNLLQQNFDSKSYAWRPEWQRWIESIKPKYGGQADDSKLSDILNDTKTSYEARMFEMLCLTRNFTSHLLNDLSIMFHEGTYEKIFEMCLAALLYTLGQIEPMKPNTKTGIVSAWVC